MCNTPYVGNNWRSKMSDLEYRVLDNIIVHYWNKLTIDELVKLTDVYKPRLLWRIKVLADRGYIGEVK
jgi:hypothetical protein